MKIDREHFVRSLEAAARVNEYYRRVRMDSQYDMSKTDLVKSLRHHLSVLQERIEGTYDKEPAWHEHWKAELVAVQRALEALGG